MHRRTLLGLVASLGSPAVARSANRNVLKIIPQGDLAALDPIWTTATVTRNHGYMVFDTLYGMAADFTMQPQMLAGHTIENDGKQWTLALREGLLFHDGEPVRGRDVVASIRRFAARDGYGSALIEATDELTAPDDRTVRFRLKKPFPRLPEALGKPGTPMPCIMPERLALTDAGKPVTEMVGSGPFRFVAAERVPGSLAVYERFDRYRPRADGPATFTAGPKRAHVERVEWHVVPDAMTRVNALIRGEVDWVEQPSTDLLTLLRGNPNVVVAPSGPAGAISAMVFNCLWPPFDDAAIRRALLGAVDQAEFMTAAIGDDHSLWKDRVAVFTPDTPLDGKTGLSVLEGPRDLAKVRREIAAAGYKGERVVVLGAVDYPVQNALSTVGADLLRRVGMNVDLLAVDWGTTVQRRASKQPPDQGGWNVFFTDLAGTNNFDPASHLGLRGTGQNAWYGWPTMPRMEELRAAWFDAPDLAAQQRICAEIERQFWLDVPYIPLGLEYAPTAFSTTLTPPRTGFLQAYDVMRQS